MPRQKVDRHKPSARRWIKCRPFYRMSATSDGKFSVHTSYLIDIIILLSAAVVAVPLFQYLKLGVIPGFLVAGIAIGPSGLGYIEGSEEITQLAEFGVVLLLFVIGIEINPSRLWNMKKLVLGLGSLQVLVTGGLITVLVHYFFDSSWNISLLIGLALSLSSTAFVLQLLTERKLLSSDYGKPSVSILLLQDLAVVPLLALVSLMVAPELTVGEDIFFAAVETLAILTLVVVAARYVLNPLLHILSRSGSPEIFTASALLLVLGTAQIMESVGLSLAMGAFIAGLLIADSSFRHQIIGEIQPFRGLLLGLFFMAMGMTLNLELFFANPVSLLLAVVALILVKAMTIWGLSRVFGINNKTSLSVALLLAQSGEFALVLFTLASSLSLLEETLFQQLLIVVMLSMLLTPILEKMAYRIFIDSRRTNTSGMLDIDAATLEARPVILAGFGRMGHRVAHILNLLEIPYVAIDQNSTVVKRERAEGKSVYFGDAQRAEVLRTVGAANAPFVVVSIDDLEAAERVVSTLHSAFPDTAVFARAHDLAKSRELSELGAYFTVSETLEASAELARAALLHMGTESQEVEFALTQFRKDYYERAD